MKTKEQKKNEIKEIVDSVKKSNGFIVFGFTKLPVNDINAFRRIIQEAGGSLQVVKRRLFRVALEQAEIDFGIEKAFLGQTGLLSFSGELFDIAGVVYRFVKEHDATIFGGFDVKENKIIEADYLERIGELPSREVMVAHTVSAIAAPLRALVYILNQVGKVAATKNI